LCLTFAYCVSEASLPPIAAIPTRSQSWRSNAAKRVIDPASSDDELKGPLVDMPSITVKKKPGLKASAKSSTASEGLALLPVSRKVCV
jgi:hypothetical protein